MSLRPGMNIALCLVVIVIMLGSVLPGVAEAQVRILSPSAGATVHGIVQIKATKPQPGEGWITYSISPSQDPYLAAVMSPFSIKWNTQLYRGEERAYPDGQYTITATGFDGSGRQQGQDSVAITVANDIDPAEIGPTVELKTNYKRGQSSNYKIRGKTTVNVPGDAGKELREPPQMGMGGPMAGGGMPGGPMGGGAAMPGGGVGMGGGMGQSGLVGLPSHIDIEIDGRWVEDVLSPSATGRAVVDKDLQSGYYTVSWLWPKEVWMEGKVQKEEKDIPDSYAQVLPTAGGEYRFKVFPLGRIEKMHEEQPDFPLGQSFIELPAGPVRVGDTWQGDMAVALSPTSIEPTIVSATHRLDSFEYRGNHRCARIVSTYTESGAMIEIMGLLPQRQEQVGGAGMPGAPGAGVAGPSGMAPGMGAGPGAMPPVPGMGGGGPGAGAAMGPPMPGGPLMGGVGSPMGGPGAMGGPGSMGAAGGIAGYKFKGDISIKRISYFSLDAGRIVAFEDTITQKVNKAVGKGEVRRASGKTQSFEQDFDLCVGAGASGGGMGMAGMGAGGMGMGGAMTPEVCVPIEPIIGAVVGYSGGMMGGGMGGAMAGGGMMGPGMPGGMPAMGGQGMGLPGAGMGYAPPMPGGGPMVPGGPGMMPGGYPGVPGPGGYPPVGPGGYPPVGPGGPMVPGGGVGMGMTMKPPTKATLEITTEWYVYDTTAGISRYAVVSEEGEQAGGAVTEVKPSEAFAHKYALGGVGAASKEGATFAVDLHARSFRPVGRYYVPQEHEEVVTTTRDYLLALGYIPE